MRLLACVLAVATVFAAWRLMRGYDPEANPEAGHQINSVSVTEDHGYCWLDIDLMVKPAAAGEAGMIMLLGAGGQQYLPAAVGAPLRPAAAGPALRFWLRTAELEGLLTLVVGRDRLRVKLAGPAPRLATGQSLTLRQTRW
jgi:hypothetical protein